MRNQKRGRETKLGELCKKFMSELPHFSQIIYVRAVTLTLVFNEIGKIIIWRNT